MTILPKIRRGAMPAVRNATLRKPVRAVMVLLATLAVPVAVFAAPLPASAAGNQLCESNGNFCVGAPDLAFDAPVVETRSGRDVHFIFLGNNQQGLGQYDIEFDAAPGHCVAVGSSGLNVVIHHCNGGLGVVWIKHGVCSSLCEWQNREFSTKFLAGHNNGTQYLGLPLGVDGWFYKFSLV